MSGTTIHITAAEGGRFEAYLALPRAGRGPGIVLCPEIYGIDAYLREVADLYAEEGYTVVVPDLFRRIQPGLIRERGERDAQESFELFQRFDIAQGLQDIIATVGAMREMPEIVGRIGALGFSLGALLAVLAAAGAHVECAVGYYPVHVPQYLGEIIATTVPLVFHFAAADRETPEETVKSIKEAPGGGSIEVNVYPEVHPSFAHRGGASYHAPSTMIAHQRSIALFRRVMGPHYDFSSLWDEHCACEFASRDVDATMATMVAQPYVNHIPTMTGGVGHDQLERFYRYHFIPKTPKDTRLIPISRTVGEGTLVDELLFCFTHDIEIDWMLPGIPPTGRRVEIPLVAIVKFRGDKLYNEHIYWDQASVLVQIGRLDPTGLPVAGIETAKKLVDEFRPSNTLMAAWSESEGKPL